jgi:hypothetical protein
MYLAKRPYKPIKSDCDNEQKVGLTSDNFDVLPLLTDKYIEVHINSSFLKI